MANSKDMNSLCMKLARSEMAVITEQLVLLAAESEKYRSKLEGFATPDRIQQVVTRSRRKLTKANFNYTNIKRQMRELNALESADNDS